MPLSLVTPGRDAPHDVNVVIEIPFRSDPVKYEVDKETGALFVDRFLGTAMHYPCNYGYIPRTLGEDGDPVDVLVVAPYPLISGSVIRCRPVGMLSMTDESGPDVKVLAVPSANLTEQYRGVDTYEDLPRALLAQISHFFDHYKDLEQGKWVTIEGWLGPDEARKEVLDGIARYQDLPEKPKF